MLQILCKSAAKLSPLVDMSEVPEASGTGHEEDGMVHPEPRGRAAMRDEQLRALIEQSERGDLSKSAAKRLRKLQWRTSDEVRERHKAARKEKRDHRKQGNGLADAPPLAGAPSRPPLYLTPAEAGVRAYAFWRRIGAPTSILAPMVNHSELAFRMLARRHGAPLVYTQMLHAASFADGAIYRQENFEVLEADRPLIAQFGGDDAQTIERAARLLGSAVDAIDLNCGCPQAIAKRGHYGAYLLDEPDLIVSIVRHLSSTLDVPVCVKIRVLPEPAATLSLALRLQEAGCVLLTVHGRTRAQKSRGTCDWAAIRAIKAALAIPVVANGAVERPEDLAICLSATGADAVMTSEAALENPAIFEGAPCTRAGQLALAAEYMELASAHRPPTFAIIKSHLFKLCYIALAEHVDLRDALGSAGSHEQVRAVYEELAARERALAEAKPALFAARCDHAGAPFVSWYRRHRSSEAASGTLGGGGDGTGCLGDGDDDLKPTASEAPPAPEAK